MFKKLVIVLVLAFAMKCFGSTAIVTTGGENADFQDARAGNSIIVTPDSNLYTAQAQLIALGTLSNTNWGAMIFTPGDYNLTAYPSTGLLWNTAYIAYVSMSNDSGDTVIERAGGGSTVYQTADPIFVRGLTIKNTGIASNDHDLLINVQNKQSRYEKNRFYTPISSDGGYGAWSCYGIQGLYGVWIDNEANDYAWRIQSATDMNCYMLRNSAHNMSYAGDSNGAGNGAILGYYGWCKGWDSCFGGCGGYGTDIGKSTDSNCLIEYCSARDSSYAMGKAIYGTVRYNEGYISCFAGWQGEGAYYGTIASSARVYGNKAIGGYCFGMGKAGCVQSGYLVDNIIGDGTSIDWAMPSTITDNGAKASTTFVFDDANNDLTFTATSKGEWGNHISIRLYAAAGIISVTVESRDFGAVPGDHYFTVAPGNTVILIRRSAASKTAAAVVAQVNADTIARRYIVASLAEGDGNGNIVTSAPVCLSGGINSPYFAGNYPLAPISNVTDFNVYPFNNGATYTNYGATKDINVIIPAATSSMISYKYKFQDVNGTFGLIFLVAATDTAKVRGAVIKDPEIGEDVITGADKAYVVSIYEDPNNLLFGVGYGDDVNEASP